mgnify:CR=1 FL=1
MAQFSKNDKLKLAAAVIILGAGVYLFIQGFKGLQGRNKKLAEDIAKSREEISKSSAIYSAQDTLNAEIKNLNSQLADTENNFYERSEDIFADLNRYSSDVKLSVKGIEPLERIKIDIPERKDIHVEILPLKLKVKCDYFQLIEFLAKIEKSEKLMVVPEIKIQGDTKNHWDHDAEVTLHIPFVIPNKPS